MKQVKVYHGGYGCETGCCGHIIEIDGAYKAFHFGHLGDLGEQTPIEFAKQVVECELGKKHCEDLDWEHAEIEEIITDKYCW